jgi:outer membrane protein insertion porin family
LFTYQAVNDIVTCIFDRIEREVLRTVLKQLAVIGLWVLVLTGPASPGAAEDAKVTFIEVQGNKRIESATILAKINTKEGDVFSPAKIKDDITALYRLGHFEDIQVKTEGFESGLKVIFLVKEKPLIREIVYEGNEEITTEKLKEVVTLLPRTAFNIQLIQENAEKIRMKYQDDGYYNTVVVPVITELRSGDRNVVFYIDEGDKITLSEVVITGNSALTTEEIKKPLKTQEHWFFSFLGRSGTLRTEELREDVEIIRDLYYNRGYIQAQVDEPVIEKKSADELTVRINVREGDRFAVGSLVVKGNSILATDELMKEISLKRGDVFSREVLRQDVGRIMDRYDSIARPFAGVVPLFDINPERKTVAVTFDIQEGGEVRIGRINIAGNIKSRDKVIRREFRLDEGDLYSKQAIKRSYERINNLNFFESVDIAPERRLQEPVLDLNVRVKEKLTGTMSIGGGYSSVDGVIGIAEVSQGNLGGRGQLLKLKIQWGGTHNTLVASFMEPYLFDEPVWGKVDVYSQSQEYDTYTLDTRGFGLGVGKSFSEYTSGSVRYSWDKSTVTKLTEEPAAGSLLENQITDYGLSIATSALSTTLARDSRDFYLDPKTGSRNSLFVQYAGGVLGGDPSFIKEVADSAWYYPLFWDTVVMARGRIGYVGEFGDKPLPLGERFFVGGPNTVRGFKYGTVGPVEPIITPVYKKDSFDNIVKDANGDPIVLKEVTTGQNRIGGNKELVFNFEYNFPIVPEARLKGVVFYDVGSAFDDHESLSYRKLRHAVGWGFRWFSPIGPLRFEWGYIINQKPEDQASQFEFNIGSLF